MCEKFAYFDAIDQRVHCCLPLIQPACCLYISYICVCVLVMGYGYSMLFKTFAVVHLIISDLWLWAAFIEFSTVFGLVWFWFVLTLMVYICVLYVCVCTIYRIWKKGIRDFETVSSKSRFCDRIKWLKNKHIFRLINNGEKHCMFTFNVHWARFTTRMRRVFSVK